MDEPTFKVSELTEAVQVALDVCFPDEVWVQGEISSLKRSAAGHVYFQLVEPGSAGAPPVAQVAITLFSSAKVGVNATLKRVGGVRMTDGVEIRLRGRVGLYGPQGRLQVRMTAIDPEYTLGRLAGERERILQALRAEDLLDRNAGVPLAPVPRRVGLVTSGGSAAEADFLHELGSSGLAWDVVAHDVRVQGIDAEGSVTRALLRLVDEGVDVIALVRGGGARTDLAAFDSEVIARTIATLPVPVFTGIGHEIDSSIADVVAHSSGKTPTACAALLVAHARRFHDRVDQVWDELARRSERSLDRQADRLDRLADQAQRAGSVAVAVAERRVVDLTDRLARAGRRQSDRAEMHLAIAAARVDALDPRRALQRGWSITRTASGQLVRSIDDLEPGTELVTVLADGEARSHVTTTAPSAPQGPTSRPNPPGDPS